MSENTVQTPSADVPKPTPAHGHNEKRSIESVIFVILAALLQVLFCVLFFVFVDFSDTFKESDNQGVSNAVSGFYKSYSDVSLVWKICKRNNF